MSEIWYRPDQKLPDNDPDYENISVEVICIDGKGAHVWGFCNTQTGMWYRTDGKALRCVRWRYSRTYKGGAGNDPVGKIWR